MFGLVNLIVVGTLVALLLLVSMVVTYYANILKESHVALIFVCFDGVLSKRLMLDYGFGVMDAG